MAKWLQVLIAGLWLCTMTVFAVVEIVPQFTVRNLVAVDYRAAANVPEGPRTTRMGIYLRDRRIGEFLREDIPEPDGSATIHLVTELALRDRKQRNALWSLAFSADSTFRTDAQGRLKDFEIHVEDFDVNVTGIVEESGIRLMVQWQNYSEEKWIPLGPDELFSTSLDPLVALPPLVVGAEWRQEEFNPINRTFKTIWIRVESKETLHLDGHDIPAYKVTLRETYLTDDESDMVVAWVGQDYEIHKIAYKDTLTFVRE